jgi:hypothetical protein
MSEQKTIPAWHGGRSSLILFGIGTVLAVALVFLLIAFKQSPAVPENVKQSLLQDRNLLQIIPDSFRMLVNSVYGSSAVIEGDKKLQLTISGQGRKVTNFFNDNPLITRLSSDDFSIQYDSVNYVVKAGFAVKTKNKESYIIVPADIMYRLVEMRQQRVPLVPKPAMDTLRKPLRKK